MKRAFFFFLISLFSSKIAQSQELSLLLPSDPAWNLLDEGKPFAFKLRTTQDSTDLKRFSLGEGRLDGMKLDSLGNFSWTPGYDLVSRVQTQKTFTIVIEIYQTNDQRTQRAVDLRVRHVNRPPVVEELRPVYVSYNSQETFQIQPVHDDDDDPLAFLPIPEQMPEGAKLNAYGEFSWRPSQVQFNRLKNKPLWIEFWVEDQPAKARTKGRLKIEATSMDLPPEVSVVPNTKYVKIKEDATLDLVFYLTDPNGDDDIEQFSFLSDNPAVPKTALRQNTPNQYEFIWKPGYDFVRDPADSLVVGLTFFVVDKTKKRDERFLNVTVLNAINERERDLQLYTQYRVALTRAWELIAQLTEKQDFLKRTYDKAKRGKKNRSVVNAGIGAMTGIAPFAVKDQNSSRLISTIGGTAVATVGTLEATEVIGRSIRDLVEQLNKVIVKRNELQTKGDIFARKYNLRSSRRIYAQFVRDLDDFEASMKVNDLLALELDATWQEKNKSTDERIHKTFRDFASFDEPQ